GSSGSNNNTVQGNLIGTNAAGTAAIGNGEGGVYITRSSNNVVGGATVPYRNVISGNLNAGVDITDESTGGSTNGNSIIGNYIGTDITGTYAIANLSGGGVFVSGSTGSVSGTRIGDSTAA